MSISATPIEETVDTMTPHQVITLLLDGALERIDRAASRITEGELDEATQLIQKTIGIIGGLRDSLDFERGGDIANNLDALYDYIMGRLEMMQEDKPLVVLAEVKDLLYKVYDGWSNISQQS
ncbi:MAG: flagellar export chaperone FliS [Cellvibrionaceae bacterium]|nr:flagellar export chaperone FliS [Cellvibrionaceae bacterium]